MAIDPSNPYSFIKRMVPETASNIDSQTRSLQSKTALQELVNRGGLAKQQSANEAANYRKLIEKNLLGLSPRQIVEQMAKIRGTESEESRLNILDKSQITGEAPEESISKRKDYRIALLPKITTTKEAFVPDPETRRLEKQKKVVTQKGTDKEQQQPPSQAIGEWYIGEDRSTKYKIIGKNPQTGKLQVQIIK